MRVKFYGTRGSTAICRKDAVEYGGNTTCLRLLSEFLPEGWALLIDTGTGFVEASKDLLKEGIMKVAVLFTHWHHDHTAGLLLAPHTHIPSAEFKIWGPEEHGQNPEDVISGLMREPVFPVNFQKLRHRFKLHSLKHIGTQVLVIHPEAGFHLLPVHVYEKAAKEGLKLALGKGRYGIFECLVVKMLKTAHPEYTVSYRFEESPPDGEVFVFLTDHENTDGIPADLVRHVHKADLLVQDCQYTREVYDKRTAGFGHGTPDYCVKLALRAEVKWLGLTHHDPGASDKVVDEIVEEAFAELTKGRAVDDYDPLPFDIFACADYEEVDVVRRED
ncbi:MAG: MBL fold metallo-hydrolase [Candidatus Magasanikbacteria bacterium]|nr:MBL fold metallo-hydrolase [Candidatus Magasanikbacteria bacterium]